MNIRGPLVDEAIGEDEGVISAGLDEDRIAIGVEVVEVVEFGSGEAATANFRQAMDHVRNHGVADEISIVPGLIGIGMIGEVGDVGWVNGHG